ncbi:hypothetical protein L7G72_01110 [Xenorhabdus bovienii]|uniref:hypothetical protein n=1 Tax=Xenorhabdus bovienii TaxID=40576 RepID=UPI001EDCBCF9|nr:hypothetical protein [Xenorhabdus bovienii]MCG3460479.1 hypothetical protein [Xenorhabdus bovienii]
MTCSGRGKRISSLHSVGVQSADSRTDKIIIKADAARRYSKAVGLERKTLFRGT